MAPVSSKLTVGSPTSVVLNAPTSPMAELPPLTHQDAADDDETWVCPASAKSLRTTNPIRAIVDPIVASSINAGERQDGKHQISLAVRNSLNDIIVNLLQ